MDALRAEGIMVNVHYTPLHRNKYYHILATDEQMPGSMKFFNRLLGFLFIHHSQNRKNHGLWRQ